jgi:hypothetical protein
MPDLDAMIQAKLAAAADLLKLPGVTGVGVGHREKGGQETDELAIRVYVEHKRPLNEVPAESRIPTEIRGFKTDVIEKGHDVLISLENKHERPIVGGLEIARVKKDFKGFALGSVCCFVTASRKAGNSYTISPDVYMLSAGHVLEPQEEAVDDRVYQPRPVGYINLCAGKADISWANDAGLALLGRGVSWKNDIYGVGSIRDIADPVQDQIVRKQGKTTGLTCGRVSAISYTYRNANMGKYFYDLFEIRPLKASELFADNGDSGGPIFTGGEDIRSNPPVLLGLMHAKAPDGSYAIASKIKNIFNFKVPGVSQEGPLQLRLAGRSGTQGWWDQVDRSVPMSLSYDGPTEIIAYDNVQRNWTAMGENGGPYTFAVDPALPQGLRLSPEGIFSGNTDSAPMVWEGNVTATDRAGVKSAPVAWKLKISEPGYVPIRVIPSDPPDLGSTTLSASVGRPYRYQLQASGGTAPYTYQSADLGNGLRLDSTGLVSGTPRVMGIHSQGSFSVTDARGHQVSFWKLIIHIW